MSNCHVATIELGEDGVAVEDWKVERGLAAAMERSRAPTSTSSPASSPRPSPVSRVGFGAEPTFVKAGDDGKAIVLVVGAWLSAVDVMAVARVCCHESCDCDVAVTDV